MDITLRRRAERVVETARADSCVFFMDKGDPELNMTIASMKRAFRGRFLFVEKIKDTTEKVNYF